MEGIHRNLSRGLLWRHGDGVLSRIYVNGRVRRAISPYGTQLSTPCDQYCLA